MNNGKGIKQKISDFLLMDSEAFWHDATNYFWNRIKLQNKKGIWESVNSKFNDSLAEELKIFSAGIFIIFSAALIGGNSLIFTAHSDENFEPDQGVEKKSAALGGLENGKIDTKEFSAYKIKSTDEICKEAKEQKKSSEICGKDDEEIIKKIKEEEEKKNQQAARSVVSKTRTVHLSCSEKNYGNPSKSDTKGKHMDEDCCPDPDEWPKPGCVYDAKGYSIMLSGPPKSKR